MKKRVIGGTVFVLSIYLLCLLDLFSVAIGFFLIVGVYELVKIMKKGVKPYAIFYSIVFLLGILTMFMINYTFSSNRMYILILITATMLNDTFAYFVGKSIGKTKFSNISPNKTIEGLLGGIVVTIIIFILYLLVFDYKLNLTIFSEINMLFSIMIIVLTLIFAIIGDLLESKLKRVYGIKDSGTIIYGHGGILDRIDSWIVASITFYICIQFISIF